MRIDVAADHIGVTMVVGFACRRYRLSAIEAELRGQQLLDAARELAERMAAAAAEAEALEDE